MTKNFKIKKFNKKNFFDAIFATHLSPTFITPIELPRLITNMKKHTIPDLTVVTCTCMALKTLVFTIFFFILLLDLLVIQIVHVHVYRSRSWRNVFPVWERWFHDYFQLRFHIYYRDSFYVHASHASVVEM